MEIVIEKSLSVKQTASIAWESLLNVAAASERFERLSPFQLSQLLNEHVCHGKIETYDHQSVDVMFSYIAKNIT